MAHLPSMPGARLIDVFKAYPELAGPLHEFAEALMRGPAPFGPAERELIAAYVSRRNGCAFCDAAHTRVAERFGIAPGTVDALFDDPAGAEIPEALRPVLAYVEKLNDRPAGVTRADVDAILEAGWDERAVVYAALVCGFFNLMNRWVSGLGIEADPKVAEMGAKHLHEHGYRTVLDIPGG